MQCLTHIFSVRSLFEKKHFINPFLLKTTHSQSAHHIHLLDESIPFNHRIYHRVANSTAGLNSYSSCIVQIQIRKSFNDTNDPKSGTPFVLRDVRHTFFLCTQYLLSWNCGSLTKVAYKASCIQYIVFSLVLGQFLFCFSLGWGLTKKPYIICENFEGPQGASQLSAISYHLVLIKI